MPDQVQTFLSAAQQAVNPPGAPPPDHNQPKVPFQSALKLTAAQEKKMLDHAFKRFHTLNNESGRDQTMTPTWWLNSGARQNVALAAQGLLTAGDTFMGKRARYDATFLNDVSWRPYTLGSPNIFQESNIPVPLVRRVCRQMIARAKEAFIGTDPWFSVLPTPTPHSQQSDTDMTEGVERFSRFKLKEADCKSGLGRAISRALVLGECPVKTTYVVRDQLFNVEAEVLVDVQGQPVMGQDGNHITKDDKFVDSGDGAGTHVLERDGQTQIENPLSPIYKTMPLNRRQVLFEGAKSEPIFFKDFLAPGTASDIQTADCIVHLYDKPVTEFVDLVVKRGLVGDNSDERLGAAQKMVALIKQMANNTPTPKAAVAQQNRPGDNFQQPSSIETGGPISEFAEFWMFYDANEDGVAENIMLIADRQSQAPIFYDHVANVTTDGLRPIEIVRMNPVEGRWYGQGVCELFESYGTIIDLLANRWNNSQSRAGGVDFWNPTNTQEGDRDPNLKMNCGNSYTLKPGMKAEDTYKRIFASDIKFEQTHLMLQYFAQLLMNESGVTNANDNQAAGMQSSELATGILEISKSGDELFKPIIQELQGPLERVLNREVDVTLSNLNPEEAYAYLEGGDRKVATLTPDQVRGLKFKCEISLTTQKDQQKLQISAAASALVEKFYMLAPAVQAKVQSFYRSQVRSLDPSCDVETVIEAVPIEPAPAEPTKSGIAVSIKWETLTPEEKQALMAKMDIQDANPPAAVAAKPAGKDGTNGSTAKLGDAGPQTRFGTQLTQRVNKKA